MLTSTEYVEKIVAVLVKEKIAPVKRVHEELAADPVWDGLEEIIVQSGDMISVNSQSGVAGFRCPFAISCISRSKETARDMMTKCDVALAQHLPIDTWMVVNSSIDRLKNDGNTIHNGWIAQNLYIIYTL